MTIIGTVTHGTMNRFLTDDFSKTGEAGRILNIGKGKEIGASRAYNPYHDNRDRIEDNKGSRNINRGLRFRDKYNLRSGSHDNNHRFSNLKVNNKCNLRLGSQDNLNFNMESLQEGRNNIESRGQEV